MTLTLESKHNTEVTGKLLKINKLSTNMACGGFNCTKNALASLNVLYLVSKSSLLYELYYFGLSVPYASVKCTFEIT